MCYEKVLKFRFRKIILFSPNCLSTRTSRELTPNSLAYSLSPTVKQWQRGAFVLQGWERGSGRDWNEPTEGCVGGIGLYCAPFQKPTHFPFTCHPFQSTGGSQRTGSDNSKTVFLQNQPITWVMRALILKLHLPLNHLWSPVPWEELKPQQ